MKPVLTPTQMYALEQAHFSTTQSPSIDLMERAASCIAQTAAEMLENVQDKRIIVACGGGNNGGDGYACARILSDMGARVACLPLSSPASLRGDARAEYERTALCGAVIAVEWDWASLPAPDMWIDAVFGIGLNRPVSEQHALLFARIERDRQAGSLVLSVDTPSGLNALNGKIEGSAVRADRTITFQTAKTGHFLGDGPDCTGRLTIADIGIAPALLPEDSVCMTEPEDARAALPPRRRNSHKGTYGHLLIVAGSFGMTGAAALSALAALRSGAGLVSIACPRSIVPILQTLVPCAMCLPMPENEGALDASAAPLLQQALSGKSAIVIGPGLTRRVSADVLRTVLESGLPAVIDADALNILSDNPHLTDLLRTHHVLTPHPGEAARLVGSQNDPLCAVRALRELGATALYKGASTLILGNDMYMSVSGCPGMATGGSGDVLSGILGALLAGGVPAQTAAWAASELHGLAGEAASATWGDVCMTARDLIDFLPRAVRGD